MKELEMATEFKNFKGDIGEFRKEMGPAGIDFFPTEEWKADTERKPAKKDLYATNMLELKYKHRVAPMKKQMSI